MSDTPRFNSQSVRKQKVAQIVSPIHVEPACSRLFASPMRR
jgi:hypothetical protein